MPAPGPIAAFLEGYTPCRRHPSRRSVGWCDGCGRSLCRACLLPEHVCPAAARPPSPSAPRRLRAAAAGVAVLGFLGLALAALTLARPGRPESAPEVAVHRPQTAPQAAPSSRPVAPAAKQVAPIPPAASPDPVEEPAPPETPAPQPPVRARAASFNRGPVSRRALVLSFDGGAEAAGAGEILDILACHGVHTTFFLTGEFIRNYPAVVRRLVAEGHEVGNHTETHLHLTEWEERRRHTTRPGVSRERLLAELSRTADAFRDLTGREMAPLWRAPYGEYNQEILGWAAAAGWRHVGWTAQLDSLDWVADRASSIYRSPDDIAGRLLSFADDDPAAGRGAIVLMHLGSQRPQEERISQALPRVLEGYRSRGFAFVTASDMMRGSPLASREL